MKFGTQEHSHFHVDQQLVQACAKAILRASDWSGRHIPAVVRRVEGEFGQPVRPHPPARPPTTTHTDDITAKTQISRNTDRIGYTKVKKNQKATAGGERWH